MYKRKGVREQVFNGELLARLRQEHGLSQEELADAINAGASQINRYERRLSEPSLAVLLRLKKILDVMIDNICYTDRRRIDHAF